MAVFTKTYTFTAGAKVKASEANQNFNDISTFLNNSVVHVDASKAFTGVPLGPSTDPSVDNHLARKKYVDDKAAAVNTTVTTNKTTTDAQALARPTFTGFANDIGVLYSGTTQYTTGPTASTTPKFADSQFQVKSGTSLVTNSGTITFGTAFPNGLVSVVASVAGNSAADLLKLSAESKTSFAIQGWVLSGGAWSATPGSFRINWIAIGW
jgi:hypothetical protein